MNDTINKLKHDYETLQTELNKLQQEKTKSENQFNEDRLEQATLEIEYLHAELNKQREEKTKFDETINSLRQDFEGLQRELSDRGLIIFLFLIFFLYIHHRS